MPARDLSELDVAAVTARDTLIASMPVLNDSNNYGLSAKKGRSHRNTNIILVLDHQGLRKRKNTAGLAGFIGIVNGLFVPLPVGSHEWERLVITPALFVRARTS
jgi:hypothetical protein